MKSAVAIITYNRVAALKETLSGLQEFCPQYPTAIFEDCGQRDGTESFLRGPVLPPKLVSTKKDMLADEIDGKHIGQNVQVFLGGVNLGVTGNSNRAIKWFMETDCDHLCLLNDDLHVLGDFVNVYAKAHIDLEIGMFSFCDFTHDSSYRWFTVNSRGYRIKVCPRMTGIMLSFTRAVVDRIGYFDARFGKFGQEHCDYMNRARMSQFMNLDGQMQPQIDLECKPPVLKHQNVQTSVTGAEREMADKEANTLIQQIASRYGQDPIYRPFYLRLPSVVSSYVGVGIPVDNLGHYKLIDVPA